MDPIEKRELKRKAWMRLAAQRRRAGLLRGRVVAMSLICFALLWGIVFVQMATGNDPVLAGKEKPAKHRVASTKRHKARLDGPKARVEEPAEGRVEEPELEEFEEPEVEEEVAPELEEPEFVEEEVEPELEEPEFEEVEPEFIEEPLVTSQS
jgi:hypothetical protein